MGGAIGALGGAGAANVHHTNDSDQDAAVGAAVGAVVGGIVGYVLCNPPETSMPPTARATANPGGGPAPLDVEFRAVGEDRDGTVVAYAWDFGDGTSGKGQRASHRYRAEGSYTAQVTVTDDDGLTGLARVPVQVGATPPPPPPAPAARRIVLRGVNFEFDQATLLPQAEATLLGAVEVLSENADVRVRVAGHTDSRGTEAYNQGLSERRAQAVRDFLIARGIAGRRLLTVGLGETRPVADNDTDDGRAQNRRVELDILAE